MVEYWSQFWDLWKIFPKILKKINLDEEWNILKELTVSGKKKGCHINARSTGVVTFVIKEIADQMGFRLATEALVEGTKKSKDFTFFRSDGKEIIHFEHENLLSEIEKEFPKLEDSKSVLKIAITYSPKSNFKKNFEKWVPKIKNILKRIPEQQWLLIVGLGKGKWLPETDESWIAYHAQNLKF